MSTEEVNLPFTIPMSNLHATNDDEAERALPDLQRATHSAPLSPRTRVAETSHKIMSYTGHVKSFFGLLSTLIMTYISQVSKKISKCHAWKQSEVENQEDSIQTFYKKFKDEPVDSYPKGWPQLAAFMHSEDNFAILRRFGLLHCRVLVQLQGEIQLLENKLSTLDQADADPKSPTHPRLYTTEFQDGSNSEKRDLLMEAREKLLQYDTLLLNEQKLREVGQTPRRDHLSVFYWIMARKPLSQYDWINHRDDFISLSRPDPFTSSILTSCFKRFFRDNDKNSANSIVDHYKDAKIVAAAKMLTISLAVGILIIPVFILLWTPKTQATISATVLISVFIFSTFISLFTKAKVQEVLVGTAAYCAVLATFLGNTEGSWGTNVST